MKNNVQGTDLSIKLLEKLITLTEQSNLLKKAALLENGQILRIVSSGKEAKLCLPYATVDFIQKNILKNYAFYENRFLRLVADKGLVKPGSIVCDIGSNIGNHAVYFGRIIGAKRVLAFEPQEHCFRTLRTNLQLNNLNPNDAHKVLLGSKMGEGGVIRTKDRNHGGTQFGEIGEGISMTTLDNVLAKENLEHLDFIKIDVEGMEFEVLTGAIGTIKRHRPSLWVEIFNDEIEKDRSVQLLAEFGYRREQMTRDNHLFIPEG